MTSNSEQQPLLGQDNSSLNNSFLNNDDDSTSSYNTVIYYSSDSISNESVGEDSGEYNTSKNQNNSSSLLSIESGDKCRICLQNIDNTLMYCKCLNTLSHIHEECLFTWLNSSVRNSLRKEEYDNHDDEYESMCNYLNNKNHNLHLVNNHYFYCEICHYRYNFFNKNLKTDKLLIVFDVILGIGVISFFLYSIFFIRNTMLNDFTISFMLNIIFLIMFMIGTIGYSAYVKFYNYKLVIYPHHSKIE